MPYKITKLSNGKYRVTNEITHVVHAKGTTKEKAEKLIKLLHYLDHITKKK